MNGVACDALDHPAEGPKDSQNCRRFHLHFHLKEQFDQ
jgi:hypothetical protein